MYIGTGTVITFDASAIAEILDVSPPGMSRESIPVSHMGTTIAHRFLPAKLYDGGEVTLDIGFDPDFSLPFSEDETKEMIITFPDSGSTTWTFNAFITNYEPTDPLEDRMTATFTFKVDGAVTIA